jgi:three-Cys-motif partner protein
MKKYEWGNDIPTIEAHSMKKHQVLKEYLQEYIRIVGRSHPAQSNLTLTLIDGFAGGGIYKRLDANSLHEGSPLIFLKTTEEAETILSLERPDRPFTLDSRFVFVEKDSKILNFLRNTLVDQGYERQFNERIFLMDGEFESRIDDIIKLIKLKGRAYRCIFLLDQYGYSDVTLTTLRKIFTTLPNAEVILTISVDFMTMFMSDSAKFRQLYNNIGFSLDLSSLPEDKAHQKWRFHIQHELERDFRLSSGAKFYTNFFIKSSESNLSYWLLHLSMHEKARDVMQGLHWKVQNSFIHEGNAGLFMLGYDANRDFDVTRQNFLFSQDDKLHNNEVLLQQIPQLVPQDGIPVSAFLRKYCNQTPSTFDMIKNAIKDAYSYGEILVTSPLSNPKRKGANIQDDDIVYRSRQGILLPYEYRTI